MSSPGIATLILAMMLSVGCSSSTHRLVYEMRAPKQWQPEPMTRVGISSDYRSTSSLLSSQTVTEADGMKIYSGSFLVFPREKNRVFMIISRERDTSHIFDVGLPRPLRATRWSDWSAPESTGDSWAWWKHVHGQEIRPLAGEDPDGSLQLRYRVEPWQSSRG